MDVKNDPTLRLEDLAQRQIASDLERKQGHGKDVALIVGGIGLGLLGVGTIGVGLWAGWAVAGVVALKLGLLGFWWHLLGFAIIGSIVMTPFLAIARLLNAAARSMLIG